jgi:zinc transport system substrate-binding protein
MKGSQVGIIGGGIAAAVIIAVLFVSMGTQNDAVPLPIENDVVIPSEDKFLVYTTFYPLYQFTQGVAGDAADVRILIPANGDPHSFELGPKTIVDLTKADMLVYNGAGFEPYIDEIMSSSDFDHIIFVDSSEGITLMEGEVHDHSSHGSHGDEKHDDHAKEDGHDDHAEEFYEEIAHVIEEFEAGEITQSQSIEEIEEILLEHEGDGHGHEGAIEDIENLIHEIEDGHMEGAEGLEEIHHLVSGEDVHDDHAKEDGHDDHAEEGDMDHTYDPHIWLDPILAKSQVMTIADHLKESDPEHADIYHDNAISYANQLDLLDQEIRSEVSSCAKDTFVPFHNAFSYFAERYDLNTLAVIQEFSPETPVTAKDIEELIHFAEDNDIKYFFTEENRNPRIAERLATELGGDILLFSPLESLSAKDDPDTTYFDKMRQNVDNLQIALECSS